MKWQYVSQLKDNKVFSKIEKKYRIKFPKDFIDFVKKYNAGTPEKYHIIICKVERVVGAILSYNEFEEDVDSAFIALDILKGKNLLPFAIDPFGNYFCYKLGKVVYWKHEENTVDYTTMNLQTFLDSLY